VLGAVGLDRRGWTRRIHAGIGLGSELGPKLVEQLPVRSKC
jgi:hypothetical protein